MQNCKLSYLQYVLHSNSHTIYSYGSVLHSHDWSICYIVNLDCGCTIQLLCTEFAKLRCCSIFVVLLAFCRMKRPLLPPHQRLEGNVRHPKLMRYWDTLFWFFCFFRWTFDLIKTVTDLLKCRCKGKFKNLRFQEIIPFYLMMRSFQLLKKNLQLEMSLFRILVCCCINFGLVNGIENILFSLRKLIQVSY